MTAAAFDLDRFEKVVRLASEGATDGERAAALARANAIAAGIGRSVGDIVAEINGGKAKPEPGNFFEGFEEWIEKREPGYKARRHAEQIDKERERLERCKDLLEKYGCEDAVFAETDRERLLRETLEPLADWRPYGNSAELYVAGYDGWTCREPTPRLLEALKAACPFPSTVAGTWSELCEWRILDDDRCQFHPDGGPQVWVRARVAALEHMMDTMPGASIEDFRARLEWLRQLSFHDFTRDAKEDQVLAAVMVTDFEALSRSFRDGLDRSYATGRPRRRRNTGDPRQQSLFDMKAGNP